MPAQEETTQPTSVIIDRHVDGLPRSPAANSWNKVTDFVAALLDQAQHPCQTDIVAALDGICDVASYLIASHDLDGGYVRFDFGALLLRVAVMNGSSVPTENLDLPILLPIVEAGEATVQFMLAGPIRNPRLALRLARAGRQGCVRFVATEHSTPDDQPAHHADELDSTPDNGDPDQ